MENPYMENPYIDHALSNLKTAVERAIRIGDWETAASCANYILVLKTIVSGRSADEAAKYVEGVLKSRYDNINEELVALAVGW